MNLENKNPLYWQLAEKLEEKILNNTYSIGDKLPSERELCNLYNVSRMTVRLAIDELERKGKIQKKQGRGTFVINNGIVQNLKNVYSFSKEMESQGKISSTQIVTREVVEADDKLSKKLDIKYREKVIFLERLRCANDVAIMVEKTWFPYKGFEFLLDADITTYGLYKTLEKYKGIIINKATETFKATVLNHRECKLLKCKNNQYGLLVKRTAYFNERLISYSTIVSKGDVFEFTIQLKS